MRVRINRDHNRHRWTVQAADGRRVGHAQALLLKDVTFVQQGPSGWADGELVSWADLAIDPKFSERLEARIAERLALEGVVFWPLQFQGGEFFVLGAKITSAGWLRILGREAEVADSRAESPAAGSSDRESEVS